MKKRYISPWHDGLIEPGMKWKDEIDENLDKMDVFVGLLTNAFLASDFIEKVEIKGARDKLQKQGKDFLFVLVLVDDVSLQGLDLSQYQVLRPGGKAVSRHKSRKEGFNAVQKELEILLKKRQELKDTPSRGSLRHEYLGEKTFSMEGITLIVEGDFVKGEKMVNDHSVRIWGDVISSQVGQTLTNCTNMIDRQPSGERRDWLEDLQRDVNQLILRLPDDKKSEAPQVAENLEMLVKQATSETPSRKWYSFSADGLLDAAKYVNELDGNIAGTIKNLGKSFWPDF
jgi:hypothetical protein